MTSIRRRRNEIRDDPFSQRKPHVLNLRPQEKARKTKRFLNKKRKESKGTIQRDYCNQGDVVKGISSFKEKKRKKQKNSWTAKTIDHL